MEKSNVPVRIDPLNAEPTIASELEVIELDDRLDMTVDPVSALLLAGGAETDTINTAYTC